jgi:hypothetical protein
MAYLLVYGGAAALGEALVARPALLWVRSQGLFHTVAAWDVPRGPGFFAVGVTLALVTLAFAFALALGKHPRFGHHGSFLALVAACLALRAGTDAPRPPPDPVPSLLAALRAAADQLDALWVERYAPDAGAFASTFAAIPPTGLRRLFRPAPLHVRVLSGSERAQLEPLEGDEPGTIYVAVSTDRSAAWLTVLGASELVRLPSGKAALIEARAGSHSTVGADPLIPAYPRMRSSTR